MSVSSLGFSVCVYASHEKRQVRRMGGHMPQEDEVTC